MWSKGVFDYDSGVRCFKVVKTTANIDNPEIHKNRKP